MWTLALRGCKSDGRQDSNLSTWFSLQVDLHCPLLIVFKINKVRYWFLMVIKKRKYTDFENNINSQGTFTWLGSQSIFFNCKYMMFNLTEKKTLKINYQVLTWEPIINLITLCLSHWLNWSAIWNFGDNNQNLLIPGT